MKTDDTTNALPEGRILNGRYRIWQMLGGGGFGLTYLATVRDAPVQGGLVVIKEHFPLKIAKRDAASGAVCISEGEESRYEWSLDSFKHEAQQLSILNHLNIIRVTDAFEENNTAYYVMPYVRGGSLADGVKWLRRNEQKLAQAAVLKLMRTLLSALEHMHQSSLRGVPVYHLDIKPGNILLSSNGVEELAVLIDFGGPEMGSPGFMPHEQRNPQEIGPWTDIYALAASMHKLLTGETPPSHFDENHEILTEPPSRPLLAQNAELLACYDIELLESIDRALSWNPAERFSDAAQWLRILDSIPLRWPDHGVDLQRLMMNIRTNELVAPVALWDTDKKSPSHSRQKWLLNLAIFLATAGAASFVGLALLPGRNSDTYPQEVVQSPEELNILREKEEAERKRMEEAEAARLKAEEEARIQREKEEAEAARLKAEEEARIQREKEEAEAARLKAEEEARIQREKEEAEAARLQAEEEARIQREKEEAEAARLQAEEEARIQREKEAEAARKKSEREQAGQRKRQTTERTRTVSSRETTVKTNTVQKRVNTNAVTDAATRARANAATKINLRDALKNKNNQQVKPRKKDSGLSKPEVRVISM